VVAQARAYYRLLLTESGLTQRLFGAMVRRIPGLLAATGQRKDLAGGLNPPLTQWKSNPGTANGDLEPRIDTHGQI
jgi:hypothetical protein